MESEEFSDDYETGDDDGGQPEDAWSGDGENLR